MSNIDEIVRVRAERTTLTPQEVARYSRHLIMPEVAVEGQKRLKAGWVLLIGAGGLGEPIVTGLALNDPSLILQGAIPAALLAVLTELAFELLERGLIPRHLLQKAAE